MWGGGRGGGGCWQQPHANFCPTLDVIPGSSLHVPQRLDCSAATGGFHTPLTQCVCHPMQRYALNVSDRAVDSEECVKVNVCFTSTKVFFFQTMPLAS